MDLFKLLGKIAIDNKEAVGALKETSGEGEKAESKLGKAFGAIGKGAAVVGKAVAAGMAAGATAVAGLVTKSVQAYAEYEQLVGGVDTLFKESSAKVQEYAANAYKTAGMSANQYMETVTSFSASLLQSLDGDTAKAAEKANLAITDMSDNANKMGTDISMIQNAYQGFAKQNYTMLDNLKLGYGGTKEEMARLLADAEKLSGQKFDLSSYADVVDAIHVIQTEMGITGTTAKEASSTISGSIASMKGAWQNLLTAISSDELPFDEYVKNFADSVSTVAGNLLPRIQIALGGVVQLIQQLAPMIIETIPGLISSILPTLLNASIAIVQALVSAFPGVVSAIVEIIPQLIDGFTQAFSAILQMLPTLIDSIVSTLPTLIPMLVDGVTQMILALIQALPGILQSLVAYVPSIIQSIVDALRTNLPLLINGVLDLWLGLINALPDIINMLIEALPGLIQSILDAIEENLPLLIDAMMQLIDAVVVALPQIINALVVALPGIINMLVDFIIKNLPIIINGLIQMMMAIVDALPIIMQALYDALPVIIESILLAVWELLPVILENLGTLLGALFEALWGIITTLLQPLLDLFANMWNGMVDGLKAAWDWCVNLLSGVGQWIYNTVIAPVLNFFKGLWDGIVKAFHTVIDPWVEIIKRASTMVYNSIIKPVLDFFKGLWEDIKKVFSVVKDWFNTNIAAPVKKVFTGMWDGLKSGAKNAWQGVKDTFSKVADFFGSIFSEAWNRVKAVFSTGGKVFEGIKEGILSVFKTVVNGLIRGINFVVKLPFEGLNGILDTIASLEILKVKPFEWLTWRAPIPKIPELEEGGVLKRGEIGILEGKGDEAVVPLHKNREWISRVAEDMNVSVGNNNSGILAMLAEIRDMLLQYFQDALEAMKTPMVLDPEGAAVALAAPMDRQLGILAIEKERGR